MPRPVALALACVTLLACGRSTLVPGSRDSAANGVGGSTANGVGGSAANGVGGSAANGVGGSAANGVGGSAANGVGGSAANGVGGSAANGVGGSAANGVGGNVPPTEDCTNALDDDGDGLVDCADTECDAGFVCTPVAPADWAGPLAVVKGQGGNALPTCGSSGGFPLVLADAFDGLTASPASCPSCTCGAPKGVACDVAAAQFSSVEMCAGGGGTLTIAANVCVAFVSMTDPASVRWASAPAGGGVCFPKASGPPTVPPITWATAARLCGGEALGGGCGADACVPRPALPFGSELCIARAGDVDCPSGPYVSKSLYFAGADDTRTCTECDCGAPTGTQCTGSLTLASDTGCNSDLTTLTALGQCSKLDPDPTPPPAPSVYKTLRSVVYKPGAAVGGSCAPVPSTTTGSAVPSGPITVCCAP